MTDQETKDFVAGMEVNKRYPIENHLFDSVEIQADKLGYSILFTKGDRKEWVKGRAPGSVLIYKKESSCKKALGKLIIQGQK